MKLSLQGTINKLHQYINFFSIYLIFEITDLNIFSSSFNIFK